MAKSKESLQQIGSSISTHVQKENARSFPSKAIARAHCTVTDYRGVVSEENFWLTNGDVYMKGRDHKDITGAITGHSTGRHVALVDDGQPISKNSKLGEILVKYHTGRHPYSVQDFRNSNVVYKNEVQIHNRSSYLHSENGDPTEVEIRISGETSPHRYVRLSELLNTFKADEAQRREAQAKLKRIEEEKQRLARELEEQRAREEQERLEALRREKEEEERKRREEVERLEQQLAETREKEMAVRSFMRKNAALRSQHLLDPYQEDAKRSHIYDGTPIVIDGGPGTGKTTTVIQRLMFLLSYDALIDYDSHLTEQQITDLTDPQERDNHWIFFSPTDMLVDYLKGNMREEGLKANDSNTRTIAKFRNKVMREYKLYDAFKEYKPAQGEATLILDAARAISDFEQYVIEYCKKTLLQRSEMKTSDYFWHSDAISIKAHCKDISKVKDIDGLMGLFNSLQENEWGKVKKWSDDLRQRLNDAAMKLQKIILKDATAVESLKALFKRWKQESLNIEEVDDDEAIVDDDEDEAEEISFSRQEFEVQLYQALKKFVKQLGLRKHDSKIKISKRNQEILDIVNALVDEGSLDIDHIGSVALFVRIYASLCRGIERNVIGIIHRLYKSFRKGQLDGTVYDAPLLKKVINKGANKHLHPDEQNLIIGFINETLHSIYKKSRIRFSNLKHTYYQAFKAYVRNVIGVDEATDYTLLDYYFMVSFRHYEFSSITLCGDMMQGLNGNGITSWQELRDFKYSKLSKLEVKTLNISYRQLPTLLDMARELYHDELGVYPTYRSEMEREATEPKPLMLISDDEWEKAKWICYRIRDILNIYDELPSIAIFVGDNVDIREFIERINELDLINGIDVVDCSGNNKLQNKEVIRVFRLSEIKGMEFEATFFYDIDDAIASDNEQLMRRYLYVGISRATSHLAATMNTSANQGIIKYFHTDIDSWEI